MGKIGKGINVRRRHLKGLDVWVSAGGLPFDKTFGLLEKFAQVMRMYH